jgi:hypothetical protein
MSELFIVAGNNLTQVKARIKQIVGSNDFELVGQYTDTEMQAEDIDTGGFVVSEGKHCLVVKV